MSKLQEILKAHKIPLDVTHDFSMPDTRTNDNLASCEAAIKAYILETIIGDDDTEPEVVTDWHIKGRNDLRADQRSKLMGEKT